MACLQPYVTLAYSQPCDIENTGIFYRYKKKLLEPNIFRMLCKACLHIENPAIFRILEYIGPEAGTSRHIRSYSIMTVTITLSLMSQYI